MPNKRVYVTNENRLMLIHFEKLMKMVSPPNDSRSSVKVCFDFTSSEDFRSMKRVTKIYAQKASRLIFIEFPGKLYEFRLQEFQGLTEIDIWEKIPIPKRNGKANIANNRDKPKEMRAWIILRRPSFITRDLILGRIISFWPLLKNVVSRRIFNRHLACWLIRVG